MKCLLLTMLFAVALSVSSAQNPDFNLTEISNVSYPEGHNDVWGYVDTSGVEYAVLGTRTATVVLNLSDPANPNQIYRVDGSQSIWRDMKTFGHYIYSICDNCNDGLVVIDMSDPENPTHQIITSMMDSTTGNTVALGAFHNIFVDEFGYLYAVGGNLNNGGITVMDLNQDAWNPHIVGYGDPRYSHDIYVRDNIIYSSDIFAGFFSVVDATDKNNLTLLATQNTTSLFTHNAWLSDDSETLFTTDELDFSNLDAYDISDLGDIKRIDTYSPPSTTVAGTTPHNAHVLNDYVVISWYTDGVKVIDAQFPDNLIEVASFDTWSGPSGGTEGNWGAYPFLPSGLLLISDIETGLHVLQPNYERAAYLNGKVTDASNGNNITEVKVDIMGDRPNLNQTNNFGLYKTGLALTGNFDVKFSHPLFQDTVINVRLKSDSTTILDVAMQPRFTVVSLNSQVIDKNSNSISGVLVHLEGEGISYDLVSDGDGRISSDIFDMPYEVTLGSWGYGDTLFNFPSPLNTMMELPLPGAGEYYVDRFIADQGWEVQNDAATGDWERGVPIFTARFNVEMNPGNDSPHDIGSSCYGTGLVGESFFDNDVDGAYNTLTSPGVTLIGDETKVNLTYDYWLQFHDQDEGLFDSLTVNVYLDDMLVAQVDNTETGLSVWRQSATINLLDFFDFFPVVGKLNVSFVIGDDEPGNPLEGAVDNIAIVLDRTVGTNVELAENAEILIYPNPVHDVLTIDLSNYLGQIQNGKIYSMDGKEMFSFNPQYPIVEIPFLFPNGLYMIQLIDENGNQFVKKVVSRQ